MPAWERALADLCLDGHPTCGRTLPITTDPGAVTFGLKPYKRGMKAALDWKLLICVALGIAAIFLLPPSIESLFDNSYLFGVAIIAFRATVGTVLGVCAYMLLFDAPR
jgi:hypothetical protein